MDYTIPKGKHRAKPVRIGLYTRRDFKWVVQFDGTAKYNIGENQGDINKLCGVRYLFGDHSARFGWRYNPAYPEMVEIMAYVHDKGNVTKSNKEVIVTSIPLNQMHLLHLYCNDTYYWFSCNGTTVKVDKTHNQKLSFRQNPYFGGTLNAPHDITIKLRNV